jgi:hypothetical protein
MKKSNCYFTNVRKSVDFNLKHYIGNSEGWEVPRLKEEFLNGVIGYCRELLQEDEKIQDKEVINAR